MNGVPTGTEPGDEVLAGMRQMPKGEVSRTVASGPGSGWQLRKITSVADLPSDSATTARSAAASSVSLST